MTDREASGDNRQAFILGGAFAMMVLIASAAGLFLPGIYARIASQLYAGAIAQDLVTLLSLPVFILCLQGAFRGMLRPWMTCMGFLIYYAYGYSLYAFGPMYDPIYPIYLPIISLGVLLIILLARRVDIRLLHPSAAPRFPTRGVVILFLATVLMLAPVWLGQLRSAMASGVTSLFSSVHVMDLAFAFPALIVAAIGLLRRRAWGTALAVPLLLKGVLVTLSLVLAEALAWYQNKPSDPWPIAMVFVLFTGVGTYLLWCSLASFRVRELGK